MHNSLPRLRPDPLLELQFSLSLSLTRRWLLCEPCYGWRMRVRFFYIKMYIYRTVDYISFVLMYFIHQLNIIEVDEIRKLNGKRTKGKKEEKTNSNHHRKKKVNSNTTVKLMMRTDSAAHAHSHSSNTIINTTIFKDVKNRLSWNHRSINGSKFP